MPSFQALRMDLINLINIRRECVCVCVCLGRLSPSAVETMIKVCDLFREHTFS